MVVLLGFTASSPALAMVRVSGVVGLEACSEAEAKSKGRVQFASFHARGVKAHFSLESTSDASTPSPSSTSVNCQLRSQVSYKTIDTNERSIALRSNGFINVCFD